MRARLGAHGVFSGSWHRVCMEEGVYSLLSRLRQSRRHFGGDETGCCGQVVFVVGFDNQSGKSRAMCAKSQKRISRHNSWRHPKKCPSLELTHLTLRSLPL
jgi:hypothetical protein